MEINKWTEYKLGDLITIKNGFAFPSKDFQEKGIPLIKQSQLNGERVSLDKCDYLPEFYLKKKNEFILYKGDILIGMSGSIGKLCVYDLDIPALQNQRTGKVVIPNNSKIISRLLWYYLNTIEYQLKEKGKGLGVSNVSANDIEALQLWIPSVSEQQRIVSKLDALMERINFNKARLEKIPQILKRFRQSVLASAVKGNLTEEWREKNDLKYEWEDQTLKNIGVISGGITLNPKRKKLELQLPYLRVGNVYSNHIILDDVKTIGVEINEANKTQLKKGDLLIVEGNGSPEQIGRVAMWNDEITRCLHQNHLIRFRATNIDTAQYVLLFLNSIQGRLQIEQISKSTSGLYTLSISKVSNLNISVPPNQEQQEIVKRVNELFALADKLEARYNKVKKTLDKLPQSILAKAFRGELLSQEDLDAEIKNITELDTLTKELKSDKVFPEVMQGVNTTDLHAGILALIIEAHESSRQEDKLNNIKAEKIAHMVEYHLGISLGRVPQKDAAGPNDYPHLKKVESRAIKSGWFKIQKKDIGYTYTSSNTMYKVIEKLKKNVSPEQFDSIQNLIQTFLPFNMVDTEVIATIHAGWNNLLLEGKTPTDEEIVYESRENWSKRKLDIDRKLFFGAIKWIRKNNFLPNGKGKIIGFK